MFRKTYSIWNTDDLQVISAFKNYQTYQVEELGAAGLIDNTSVDSTIFGTGKFYQEKQDDKKEDIYSNIDMLSSTLKNEDKVKSFFKKNDIHDINK